MPPTCRGAPSSCVPLKLAPLLLLLHLLPEGGHSLGDLDYSRLHIVDVYAPANHQPTNLLMRSNMPVNNTGFDLEGLIAAITKRATALHLALDYPLYLL
eukprot:COSAG03_NODE_1779_length_3534_cov_4.827074_2_plen_99_part_00